MTNTQSPSGWAKDKSGDRCLQYLMGELSPSDADAFEAELAQSPELMDELERQSEMICYLSEAKPVSAPVTSVAEPVGGYIVIKVVTAIAACLMLAFLIRGRDVETETPQAEQDLMIAQAWVDASESFESSDLEIENDMEWQDSVVDDASLSWVMAAFEAEESVDG